MHLVDIAICANNIVFCVHIFCERRVSDLLLSISLADLECRLHILALLALRPPDDLKRVYIIAALTSPRDIASSHTT
jgi:hypothetical protein